MDSGFGGSAAAQSSDLFDVAAQTCFVLLGFSMIRPVFLDRQSCPHPQKRQHASSEPQKYKPYVISARRPTKFCFFYLIATSLCIASCCPLLFHSMDKKTDPRRRVLLIAIASWAIVGLRAKSANPFTGAVGLARTASSIAKTPLKLLWIVLRRFCGSLWRRK